MPNSDPKSAADYLINFETAYEMIRTYRSSSRVAVDSLTGTYPIDVLTDYIAYITTMADDLNINIAGIRYYHAAYPQGSAIGPSGQQTIVFYPTTMDKNAIELGFDPGLSSNDDPYFIDTLFNSPNLVISSAERSTKEALRGVGGLNKSLLCPPRGNC